MGGLGRRSTGSCCGGWRSGDFAGRVLVPALADRGIRRLEAVLLTHGDQDHCGGILQLLGEMEVGEVWASPGTGANGCGAELLRQDNRIQLRDKSRHTTQTVGQGRYQNPFETSECRLRWSVDASNDASQRSAGGDRVEPKGLLKIPLEVALGAF